MYPCIISVNPLKYKISQVELSYDMEKRDEKKGN